MKIQWISGLDDLSDAFSVRTRVFIEEQRISRQEEFDDTDFQAEHLVLYYRDNPVAVGRVYKTKEVYHLGRIAVLREFRGRGYGKTITRLMLERVFDRYQAGCVHINAQVHAVTLYQGLGFKPYGKPFSEAGIEHIS